MTSGIGAYMIDSVHIFKEGFSVSQLTMRTIVPPLKNPNNTPGNFVMQPYGIHNRSIHPGAVRNIGDPIFDYNPYREHFTSGESVKGLDKNISVSQDPIAYSGITEEQITSPLSQQLSQVQSVARGTIPTNQNLEMISGGSGESANTPLSTVTRIAVSSQAYQPHKEKIYPDQHPRPQHPQLTAGAPTDTGTGAEEIQKTSVRTPSVREHVREEERSESESFNNPYAVRYQAV